MTLTNQGKRKSRLQLLLLLSTRKAARLCVNLTPEQEERERMAADPRFAAWVAGQPENQGEEA